MMRRGELSPSMTVDQVLRWSADRRESGAFLFDADVRGTVWLTNGEVCFATTAWDSPVEERLVMADVITREQLAHAVREAAAGKDLSFVLACEPGIDQTGVVRIVHDHIVEALSQLLGATEGSFHLNQYETHPLGVLGHWPLPAMLDLASRRFRRRAADPGAVRSMEMIVQPVTELDDDHTDITLSPTEWRFLMAGRQGARLADVAARSHLSETTASTTAERLRGRGLISLEYPTPDANIAPMSPNGFQIRTAATAMDSADELVEEPELTEVAGRRSFRRRR